MDVSLIGTALALLALILDIICTAIPNWFKFVERTSIYSDEEVSYYGLFKRCINTTKTAFFCKKYSDDVGFLPNYSSQPDFLETAQAMMVLSNLALGVGIALVARSMKMKVNLKMHVAVAAFIAGVFCVIGLGVFAGKGMALFKEKEDEFVERYSSSDNYAEYKFEYSLHASFGLAIVASLLCFATGGIMILFALRGGTNSKPEAGGQ